METSHKFEPFSLVLGILSIIFGFFILNHPGFSLVAVIFTTGIFMILDGILHFGRRNTMRKLGMVSTGFVTFAAVLDIIVGIAMLIMPGTFGVIYVWMLVAIGLFVDSLFELWIAKYIKDAGKGYYWFTVIASILGVLLAILMLFSPAFALTSVLTLLAIYSFVFGITQIVKAF